MAPPMKELPRWLLDNPEFSVAPDWTDIVKQSVSNILPFNVLLILTGYHGISFPKKEFRLTKITPFHRVSCLKPCLTGSLLAL